MADLKLDVFVGGDNAFNVTSTIVSGERDAVLIDGQFTRTDAERLAETIKASGKNMTAVYITHGHPDHYWGLTTLRAAFPQARFVTAPEVIGVIEETLAAKVAQWKPLYGDEVPDEPLRPEALDDDDGTRILLDQTRDYVAAFDAAVERSSSKEELVERVTAQYGDRALPMILDIAAGAAFPG